MTPNVFSFDLDNNVTIIKREDDGDKSLVLSVDNIQYSLDFIIECIRNGNIKKLEG